MKSHVDGGLRLDSRMYMHNNVDVLCCAALKLLIDITKERIFLNGFLGDPGGGALVCKSNAAK